MREHVGAVVGDDIDAQTDLAARRLKALRDRKSHGHLQLCFGRSRERSAVIGNQAQFVILETPTMHKVEIGRHRSGFIQPLRKLGVLARRAKTRMDRNLVCPQVSRKVDFAK